MTEGLVYLEELQGRAGAAEAEEAKFRREAARRIKELERERVFAFRRYNLVKEMLTTIRPHAEQAAAVAAAQVLLRQRFGWPAAADERHQPVLEAFAPFAAALYLAVLPEPPLASDPAAALAEFERWFEARSGRSFWALQDEAAAQTPLVDF